MSSTLVILGLMRKISTDFNRLFLIFTLYMVHRNLCHSNFRFRSWKICFFWPSFRRFL